MSSNTKQRILHTAIQLFNEFGSSAISTNRIAQIAEISPGNLYYYFKNKEDIIRAILETMIVEWDALWLPQPEGWQPMLDDLKAIIHHSLSLQWKYRFFYRELILLIKNDPKLKETHESIQQQRIEEQKQFFQHFVDAGVVVLTEPAEDMDSLLKASWIISNYWLTFLETSGVEVDESHIEEGIELILSVLRPYFKNKEGV